MSGSTYQVTAPSDWVVQQLDASCGGSAFSCGVGSWSVSGATLGSRWYFALARKDGTCGTATVTVNRLQ